MLERNQIAGFQDWTIYAPKGEPGPVFSLYNIITGGNPTFKGLRGCDIRELPSGYRAELTGTTQFEEGLKKGCASWNG